MDQRGRGWWLDRIKVAPAWAWALPSVAFSLIPILQSLGLAESAPEAVLRLTPFLGIWANLGLLLVFAVIHDSRLAGLRWPLSVCVTLALLHAVALTWRYEAAAMNAVVALSWAAAAAILGAAAVIGAPGPGFRERENMPSLFGEFGIGLDRLAPLVPISAIMTWGATRLAGGDGINAAVVLCASLVPPGAILAWPALWETASAMLRRRRVENVTPRALGKLAAASAVVFQDPASLVADRIRVAGVAPVEGISPGRLIAIASALYRDGPQEEARALMEFGVAHRIRIGDASDVSASAGLIRGGVSGQAGIVLVGPEAAMLAAGLDNSEQEPVIAHHRELGRVVLLVALAEPTLKALGAIFLAHPARPGASEAIRALRADGLEVRVGQAGNQLPGAEASLRQLKLTGVAPGEFAVTSVLSIWRGDCVPLPADRPGVSLILGGIKPANGIYADDARLASEDPRSVPELLHFAKAFTRRQRLVVVLMAVVPAFTLALLVSGLVATAKAISIVGLLGLVLAAGAPQALRASPSLVNHQDRED